MKLTQRFILFAAVAMIVVAVSFVITTEHTLKNWRQESALQQKQSSAVALTQQLHQINAKFQAHALLFQHANDIEILELQRYDAVFIFDKQLQLLRSASQQQPAFTAAISQLLQSTSLNQSTSCCALAIVDSKVAMFDIQQINQTWLVQTQIFDQQTLAELSQTLSANLTIQAVNARSESTKPLLDFDVSEWVAGPILVDSYLSNNGFELTLEPLAETNNSKMATLYNYAVALLAIIVVVLLSLMYALEKRFILPISRLNRQVSRIRPGNMKITRVKLEQDDEIGELASTINEMLAEIFAAKEFNKVTLNSIGDAVITTDLTGRITYANASAEVMLNRSSASCIGSHVAEVLPFTDQDDVSKLKQNLDEVACLKNDKDNDRVTHKLSRGLDILYVEKHITLLRNQDEEATGTVMVLRDVSQSERLRKKLDFQASYDAVTKLFNRHKYEDMLANAVHTAKREGRQHLLAQIDLDRFKLINDSAGHAAGDQLLFEVGTILKSYIRKSDICARIGGDEFGIILYDAPISDGATVLKKIVDQIRNYRFIWGGKVFSVGASVGITTINNDSYGEAEIRREADAACYMAKNLGQNNIRIFDSNNESLTSHHQAPRWASRINEALVHDKFELFFQRIQPIVFAEKQREHLEILLRMDDDNNGLLSPATFLPAAERFRLTPKIDRWVIKSVFRWIASRPHLWDTVTLSINLSGESLTDEELYGFIVAIHARAAFPTQTICFEVTETAAVSNLVVARELIQKLRSYGFTFALDDFGKGFSSYSYLQNLPAEYVKIDGSFVKEMTSNDRDKEIVRSIHQISNVMGMKTIAEYVEDEHILEELTLMGVDYAQGFGIQRPARLSSFESLSGAKLVTSE